jgi:tetratricopeptide (TPR) repeat protein
MQFIGKTRLLIIFTLFFTLGLWCGQSVAKQSLTPAMEYAAQGKFKEAKEEFERILKVDPLNERAKLCLRIIENVTDKKLERKSVIYLFKGAIYADKGLWDEAIAEYNRAIELNPRFVEAYFARGVAHIEGKGQYDKAISDFTEAIKIAPEDADAYNNRGVALHLNGDYEKAWEDVHKVESLGDQVHPDFQKALSEASGRSK